MVFPSATMAGMVFLDKSRALECIIAASIRVAVPEQLSRGAPDGVTDAEPGAGQADLSPFRWDRTYGGGVPAGEPSLDPAATPSLA